MKSVSETKKMVCLRVRAVALGINRCQIFALLYENFKGRLAIIVVKTELDFATNCHRAVTCLAGCRVDARHRITPRLVNVKKK